MSFQYLPYPLNEFCVALTDEINAASSNLSNNSIPLSNGKKISSDGISCKYEFLIDTILNTPGDTPGNLVVQGYEPIPVSIISSEGLQLIVSIEKDIGPFIPTAYLQTNLTFLLRKLIERIESSSKIDNHAANRMLGYLPFSERLNQIENATNLNLYQRQALESSLNRNMTFIWGPPGTGKTYTIGTIAENLYKQHRTVLIVSHTNIAIDQAIKHVATSLKEELTDGNIIRVGEIKDESLGKDYPEVIIGNQIFNKSKELIVQKNNFENEVSNISKKCSRIEEIINIKKWLGLASEKIGLVKSLLLESESIEKQKDEASKQLDKYFKKHPELFSDINIFNKGLQLEKTIAVERNKIFEKKNILQDLSNIENELKNNILIQENRIEISQRIAFIKNERKKFPKMEEQQKVISQISYKVKSIENQIKYRRIDLFEQNEILNTSLNTGALGRLIKRIPKSEVQKETIARIERGVLELETRLDANNKGLKNASDKLAAIIEMDEELLLHKDILSAEKEQQKKRRLEKELNINRKKLSDETLSLSLLEGLISEFQNQLFEIKKSIGSKTESSLIELQKTVKLIQEYKEAVKVFAKSIKNNSNRIDKILFDVECSLKQVHTYDFQERLPLVRINRLQDAYVEIDAQYKSANIVSLKEQLESIHSEIKSLRAKIDNIDLIISKLELEIIKKASVIGATLTKTYLSDNIISRKFDTVILDEASMAAIPALWFAASLVEVNLIIVGDFKQLPPIVISKSDLAKKWLGTDIFAVSGIKEKYENCNSPLNFLPLLSQRRMVPEIAQIANIFYDGNLENEFEKVEDYKDLPNFSRWYNNSWGFDSQVLLVDTASLNAWVTSVIKSGNSSRLNYLSASLSLNIAEQLLDNKETRSKGSSKKILLISPYRAHSKLTSILLKDMQKNNDDNSDYEIVSDVVAGTAHSFQGSEADVVIFDLVADEPHFRVNLFIPDYDEVIKALLNVALTRAKFRLIIIGNFDYCLKRGKNSFLGKTLLPFLLSKFKKVSALEIAPCGLAGRAANAQTLIQGGVIEAKNDRIIVNQENFYKFLYFDIANAKKNIIIYSPFITIGRVSEILIPLQAAIERSIQIFIVTKAVSERSTTERQTIISVEKKLSELGIIVIHKLRMHEKLIFIDDDIIWSGSLNPLSFKNTQEVMERRKSRIVYEEYSRTLRIKELINVPNTIEAECPICKSEMIAAEGADEPYYWTCINKECFTRSIDQAFPIDGILRCNNCNADVEYGVWGEKPHWRCKENNRHRQPIYKSHLKLPRMAALIPHKDRSNLCKMFNIENFNDYMIKSPDNKRDSFSQGTLFDN